VWWRESWFSGSVLNFYAGPSFGTSAPNEASFFLPYQQVEQRGKRQQKQQRSHRPTGLGALPCATIPRHGAAECPSPVRGFSRRGGVELRTVVDI